MKLQQLRYVCEIVGRGLNLTRAARELHTSQPGISRHVRLLEEELGVQIFVRERKRITSLTPIGAAVFSLAKKIVNDVENIRKLTSDFVTGDVGDFVVATSHTHARYSLAPIIERFVKRYPKVRLRLRQGLLPQVCDWVRKGEADLSISTAPDEKYDEVVYLPYGELHRVVLALPDHPLIAKRTAITLKDLARHPIITYDHEFSARLQIEQAFLKKRLKPNIVLSATDTDTMKIYVQSGLGVAIMAHTAYSRQIDLGLRAVDARHLFPSSPVLIGLRRNIHLPAYLLHFVELVAPHLKRHQVIEALTAR